MPGSAAHAMAQALGGTYGLSHGAMNALTLPPALRFNAPIAPDAVRRFGAAIGNEDDPAVKVEELAHLGGFGRLREFGISERDLAPLAVSTSQRGGNQMNPKQATPAEIENLFLSIW